MPYFFRPRTAMVLPVMLAVFSPGGSAMTTSRHPNAARVVHPFLPPPSAQDVADMNRYFPIKNYRSFPKSIRALLQRNEYEHDSCRGMAEGQKINGLSRLVRCNRAHRALALLEEKGWCWGGAFIEADKYWIPCRKIPGYVIGTLRAEGDPFSAADIREEERGARQGH